MSESLALLTDLYQLTMAYGYWKRGMADREAIFHHFFRKRPFGGEFAIACGLAPLIDFVEKFRYSESDLEYVAGLKGWDGKPLFETAFIDYLRDFRFSLTIDAMVEGTPLFPYEPMVRVQGSILQAQLLESPLLNIMNFQSLIATKAMRICFAAGESEVVEFGMRRAQGVDGAISASRAAYIGGCASTSNVIAGKLFDIPVKGTQAHSWIMCFDDEMEAFEAFAEVMPGNCVSLIDTYDSVRGTEKALEVARAMRARGEKMLGLRIDSGDLAQISKQVRQMLDDAGFPEMKIMASNELDEEIIRDLKHQGARIDLWGVGTSLVTGREQPALDGVYKLSMVKNDRGEWTDRIKLSEQTAKMTTPGKLQVRRFIGDEGPIADMIFNENQESGGEIVDIFDRTKTLQVQSPSEDLLRPIFSKGSRVYDLPSIHESRLHAITQIERFPLAMRRFKNPTPFFVGLERGLWEAKYALVQKLKGRG